ncbi:MAG: magnesium transporter [Bacteroidota bacterium]|nr:magnesium transporter [Bacteroidota bacterium]
MSQVVSEKQLLLEIQPFLSDLNESEVRNVLEKYRPEDIADIFWDIVLDEAKLIIKSVDNQKAVDIIRSLDEDLLERFLKGYTAQEIANNVISFLNSDDAVDILNILPTSKAEEVLSFLEDQEYAKNLVAMLHYDDDVAGGLMAKELVQVKHNWTVSQCIEEIRKQAEEVDSVHAVYVVNEKNILQGVVSLKDIVLSKPHISVIEITNVDFISVNAYATGEEVARIMNKYDLITIPVIDSMGRLIGRITIDDVVDFIKEEADRDFQLQAGLSESVESGDSVFILSRARLPWLMIGLVGGLGSSMIISNFEGDIAHLPKMAFFMPVVAAMGGNAGVQSSAIIVQGLANNTLISKNIIPKLGKEFTVSLFNGLVCSVIMLSFNIIIGHGFDLSFVVSLALVTVIIFASILGTITPLVLDKFKIDPALATGPFITTTNDIIGLGVYFSLGRLLLGAF